MRKNVVKILGLPILILTLAVVVGGCSLFGGSADEVKDNMFSALDSIENYAYTEDSSTTLEYAKDGETSETVTTTATKGIVDFTNQKINSDVTSTASGTTTETTIYIEDGFAYQLYSGQWLKMEMPSTESYFHVEGQKEMLNNSTIEVLEQSPMHLKVSPSKTYLGEKMLTEIVKGQPDFGDQYTVLYDQAITDADVEYWLDDDYRITKMTFTMTLRMDKDTVLPTAEEFEALGEGEYMIMTVSTTTNSTGYNSQEGIVLPEEAKNAQDVAEIAS